MIKVKSILFTLICVTACSSLGIYTIKPFPPEKKNIRIDEEYFKTTPLSDEDINTTYLNIDDLDWLKPIAKKNKVILLGENHYYQIISHLRNRIFFALNTFDYYHLLSMELQYSSSPFMEYYVNEKDPQKAMEFFEKVISPLTPTRELLNLINHTRKWNLAHPDKPLHLSAHDLEHNYLNTINFILLPYFQKIDPSIVFDKETMSTKENFDHLYKKMKAAVEKAKEKNISGEYSFITPEYIDTVIENLKSTIYSKSGNEKDFSHYRQKAIVRNLTDPDYLGTYFQNGGKVLLYGGGYHMPTKEPSVPGKNYLKEGMYLTYEFGPTKGKTYSLLLLGGAFKMGPMGGINLNDYRPYGSGYNNLILKYNKELEKNRVCNDEYYFFYNKAYNNIFYTYGNRNNNTPYRIHYADWNRLAAESPVMKKQLGRLLNENYPYFIKTDSGYQLTFDDWIVIPKSPILQLLPRGPYN